MPEEGRIRDEKEEIMGYMRHHAIIVTSERTPPIVNAVVKAVEIFGPALVTPLTVAVINNSRSFMVAPDGSKEGWPESDQGDSQRDRFIQYLRSTYHDDGSSSLDWVEVQFGDDDKESKVVRSSDMDYEEHRQRLDP